MSKHYGLGCCNVFHAGDGNLHPLIIFDAMKEGELDKAEAFGADILRLCVEVGGVLTGEHGVGIEKRDLMTGNVLRGRSGPAAPHQMRLRWRRVVQSRQGVSHFVGLCRAGPYACAWRPTAASRSAALLMTTWFPAKSEIRGFRAGGARKPRAVRDCRRRHPARRRQADGRRGQELPVLDVSGLSGIVEYQPEELIVTARPGTPLAELKAALAEKNQCLGFDPVDWTLFGAPRQSHAGRRGVLPTPAAPGGCAMARRGIRCWAFAPSTGSARPFAAAPRWSRMSPALTCPNWSAALSAPWRCSANSLSASIRAPRIAPR